MASSKKGSAGRPRTSPRPTSARPVTAATRTSASAPEKGAVSTPLVAKAPTSASSAKTTGVTPAGPSVRRSASATATQRQRQRQAQLEIQRRRQYITAVVVAVVVVALAIGVFSLIPRSTKNAAGASATTAGYGILANFTPGTKGNIPGVNATPTNLGDGLQYVDVKVGSGQAVKSTDTITVNYTGWLTDGTKFDSSYDHGQAAQFPLSGVIPGWTKGLVGMKIGGERRLLIPPALGYGAQGQPPTIPGNATLIFDVSLVSIP